MKFKGIIFDFNGVLLWDSHLHEKAWNILSEEIRGKQFASDEIIEHLHGRTNKVILEYLNNGKLSQMELKQFTQKKENIYRTLCLEHPADFKLSPGTIELLNQLKLYKIPFTIATSSDITNLDFYIQYLDLGKWFKLDLIVCDNFKRPGKPAPDIYLEAAFQLNLHPSNCIVVEDSLSGIKSAFEAGIGQIIALGPEEIHHDLKELPGVNKTIKDLNEISLDLFLSVDMI